MTTIKHKAWPWLALAGLLTALGLFALDGAAAGVALILASIVVFAAVIRALRGSVDDVEGMEKVGIGIGIGT